MGKIKTSFIIPCYNHARYLNICLNSVLENNFEKLELLICDDASTDSSSEIICEWIKLNGSKFYKTNFIQHDKNKGITHTLNELISIAEGEIITGVASDDYVLFGGIKDKCEYMLSNPKIFGAFSDAIAIGLDGQLYSESIIASSGLTPNSLVKKNIFNTVLNQWIEPMNLQFWRRSCFKSHGGEFEFDGTIFCEDLNFAIWALSKNKFGFLNQKCVAYRCRVWPQVSAATTPQEFDSKHLAMAKCFDLYKDKYKLSRRKKILIKRDYYQKMSVRDYEHAMRLSLKLKFMLSRKTDLMFFYNFQKHLLNKVFKHLKKLRIQNIIKSFKKLKNSLTILDSGLFDKDFFSSKNKNTLALIYRYSSNWEKKTGHKKPFPGFHPKLYASFVNLENSDPLVHYIKNGKPQGEWNFKVITPDDKLVNINKGISVAFHIHIFYPEMADEIISRISNGIIKPDLLISTTTIESRDYVSEIINNKYKGTAIIRLVPNKGRDLGPLLTEFAAEIKRYDIIGHFHTKASPHLSNRGEAMAWYQFLLENVIGGKAAMMDVIISSIDSNPNMGLVFPEDPHIFGWDNNYNDACVIAKEMGIKSTLPGQFNFPAGSMFWARTKALMPLFDLNLAWGDYPEEPIDHDGTMLHAIERLIPIVAKHSGFDVAVSHVPGITY